MFSEPQSLTVNGTAVLLPRVAFGDRNGTFEAPASGLRLLVSHLLGRRNRRTARVDFTKTAADPLLDGVSRQYTMSAYLVIDHPPVGFSVGEVEANAKVLSTWLGVPGNLSKLVGGES